MDRGELVSAAIFSVGPKDLGQGVNNAYPVRVLPAVKCTEEQLRNAVISYAPGCAAGDVSVLVDISLSGTGEKGFLFTADRFYSDESEFLDGRLHPNVSMPIRYGDLDYVEPDKEHTSHIVLHYTNGTAIRTYTGIYTCFFAAVFEAILRAVNPDWVLRDNNILEANPKEPISESGAEFDEPEPEPEVKYGEPIPEPETVNEVTTPWEEPKDAAEEAVEEAETEEPKEAVQEAEMEESEEAVQEAEMEEPEEAVEEAETEEQGEEKAPGTPDLKPWQEEAAEEPEKTVEEMSDRKPQPLEEKTENVQPQAAIGEEAKKAYQRGVELYNGGDAESAIKEFLKAANAGHVIAQYKCGMMYDYGWGAVPDKTEALKWYLKAAENGHEEAPYICGMMYYDGEGTKQDQIQAKYWFEKAAAQGNEDAKIWLEINNLANS